MRLYAVLNNKRLVRDLLCEDPGVVGLRRVKACVLGKLGFELIAVDLQLGYVLQLLASVQLYNSCNELN